MEFYCLEKTIILPVKRLCRGLATRFGFRKRGILMLSQEVQACEYEDVRRMWEMLKKSETQEVARSPSQKSLKNKPLRNALSWARMGTCLSGKF
ncbi:Long-chain-fatty-acid--CoA ligase ACSBG2 [Bienertia sinuspersici]